MHDFLKTGDTVTFTSRGEEYHGTIRRTGKNSAVVFVEGIWENRRIALNRLTYVPPVILTAEQIRKLCRYEVKWSELRKGYPDFADVFLEESYTITFADVLTAVENIKSSGDDNETVADEWYSPLYEYMFEYVEAIEFEGSSEDVESHEYLPGRADCLYHIFYDMLEGMLDEDNQPICRTITEISGYIRKMTENEKKPLSERSYTDAEKEYYLQSLGNDDRLKTASESELALYRKFIDELCQKDNQTALRCKGYGCYGGDSAYECNWNTSLECVRKLFELTGDPMYANTLGYIFYYGRCWDGVPQYEEAFRYFSIGAAGYYYESRYKLADMFVHGYAVPKNTGIAYTIIEELYNKNYAYITEGKFDCKFADIALRLGSYTENGYGGYADADLAYSYYLQADYAIRQRLQYDYYGDFSVADSIRQKLNSILASGRISRPVKSAEVNLISLLRLYLRRYQKLQLKIKSLKNNVLKLMICIAPHKDEKYPSKLFITETSTGFCGLLETLSVKVKNSEIIDSDDIESTVYFDDLKSYYAPDLYGDDAEGFAFMFGENIQTVITGKFMFSSPVKTSGKKYRIASVYFTPGGRHYDYLLELDTAAVGDVVCVMTDHGKTEVTIANISEKHESELTLPIGKYKKITSAKG